MRYTVILKSGKVFSFHVLAVAETYIAAYGGILVDDKIYSDAYSELLESV